MIESLIRCGAFDGLHANRRALMEVLDPMMEDAQREARDRLSGQETLFSLEEFAGDDPREIEIPEIPDWPVGEKLKMERAGMGFYISGHPLDGYTDVIERFATATSASVGVDVGNVILAGVLNELKVTRTKKGESMARAMLEDLEGFVPIVFFPKVYSQYQDLIAAEIPVMVKAEVKQTEGEEMGEGGENHHAELMALEVHPLEGAETMLATRVLVRLDREASNAKLAALKETVSGFSGPCPLSFVVETEGAVVNIDAGNRYMVNPSRDFLDRVRTLLGSACVEVQ